jgi:hypothetical protein
MAKQESLTYTEAFEKYFGKVKDLKTLPYKCKCGCGEMNLSGIWSHIRTTHNERLVHEKRACHRGSS